MKLVYVNMRKQEKLIFPSVNQCHFCHSHITALFEHMTYFSHCFTPFTNIFHPFPFDRQMEITRNLQSPAPSSHDSIRRDLIKVSFRKKSFLLLIFSLRVPLQSNISLVLENHSFPLICTVKHWEISNRRINEQTDKQLWSGRGA